MTSGFAAINEARPALARSGDVELVDLPAEFADIARWAATVAWIPGPLLSTFDHLQEGCQP